ncbi:MAG: ATP-binding cassette domain-containing protein [Candidatus Eisenbacteria bacterium]|nr:ATP-binding cassette domain-containing protein [Candidatus Eisenbacteria bacterium]MCC7141055.1 ATP-binding cassette domain-containing protein [Candidatus Eisenbacteria bacterium]
MIEVRNLVKRYGPNVAVNDVSFEVPRGEVVGFLGPNGAGKTTTMRVLTCYLPADGGSAKVAGHDVFENPVEVRKRIGYLPESAPLYLDMGVIEYLEFVGGMREVPKTELPRRIHEMVDACGLGPMVKKDIGQLSKGYRQRVGLAATLIHNPDVLVLDEPTTGLDPNQIIEIRQLIRDIGREKTVILSTHILPEVEATCSRVLIINEGRIVAQGTPEELTRRAAGEQSARASFKAGAAEVEPRLRAMNGVTRVRPLEAIKAGTCRYELTWSGAGSDLEEEIFRLAVAQNWILTELHAESLSLEQVFTKLTVGEK